MRNLSDASRRALRTLLQAGLGAFAVIALPFLADVTAWASGAGDLPDWSILGRAGVAGLVGVAVAGISWAQNALEDRGKIPALLKDQAHDR